MYCTCQLCEVERLVPMLNDCVFAVHKCSIEIEENSCKGLPLDWSGKRWLLDIRRHDELFFEKVTWKLCGAKICLCMLLHTEFMGSLLKAFGNINILAAWIVWWIGVLSIATKDIMFATKVRMYKYVLYIVRSKTWSWGSYIEKL